MTSIATLRLGARKSSDGGVEGHAGNGVSTRGQNTLMPCGGERETGSLWATPFRAGIKPGPSETPQACIAGIREFIRDAGEDDLTFAGWCALGLSVIHEVEAAHG